MGNQAKPTFLCALVLTTCCFSVIMDFLRIQNKLRAQIQAKGTLTAVRNLARAMRGIDEKNSYVVNRPDFEKALAHCELFLNTQEVDNLVSHYDMAHSGSMMYEEFLTGLRGTLNHRRRGIVQTIFDSICRGAADTTVGTAQQHFDARGHPDVQSGTVNAEDIHNQFLEIFDSNPDQRLSYEEFERYMGEISACFDKDTDFVNMLCATFGVSEAGSSAPGDDGQSGAGGPSTQPFSMEARSQLAVQRRRAAEDERKARLLDPKVRMIGVDVDALNRQVEEKRRMQEEELQKVADGDKQARLVSERGMALERQVELQRRQAQCDDVAYNHAYQRKQFRREYDLSNPDMVKNDMPIRMGDDDPRLGACSMQLMHGEDSEYSNRVELQRAQQRAWCLAQMDEKANKAAEDEQAERVFHARQQEHLSRAVELESIQSRQARETRMVADEFNHAMVVQKKEEQRQSLLQDAAEELEELRCNLDSALLSEIHEPSALGAHRKRQDAYKGMSGDEVVDVYMSQERQRRENQAARQNQGKEDQAWADYDSACTRAGMAMEREEQRARRETSVKYAEAQKQDAKLQHTRKEHMNQVFRNELQPEYFSQFGTSAR